MRISPGQVCWRALFATSAAALTLIAASSIAQTQPTNRTAREEFLRKLVAAAEERTHHIVRYDPAYVRIPYPGGDVPHIGIVVDEKPAEGGRHLIVHNIGQGPKREDVLFAWKITGHYRYYGPVL
jgi:uncharacterized protein YijF (DUF1287 family)